MCSSRLEPVACFPPLASVASNPALGTIPCFPALGTGYVFPPLGEPADNPRLLIGSLPRLVLLLLARESRKRLLYRYILKPSGSGLSAVLYSPFPQLNTHTPPSRPWWILFLLRTGLLSVLIQTPAIALSKISFSSSRPRPGEKKSHHTSYLFENLR